MRSIPCTLMRGGTSKGPFLRLRDLPAEPAARDAALLAIVGSGQEMEIDGVGGGYPQSSKVAMVDRSAHLEVDVDYLFAQVGIQDRVVDTAPNCGNMLVAVGPFAIEAGLVHAQDPETTVRIRNVNTDTLVDAVVQTPGGRVVYDGQTAIAGVPGTAAPVRLVFRGGQGARTGKLFPTGKVVEQIDGIDVTLIDMSVPVLMLRAESLGKAGHESPEVLDADDALLARLESLRLEAGRRMGLGDVRGSVLPKIILVAAASAGNSIAARYFMPHSCHRSFAVTGGICLATASITAGTVAAQILQADEIAPTFTCRIEHPAGILEIEMESAGGVVLSATMTRTARKILSGEVFLPQPPTAMATTRIQGKGKE